MPTREPAKMSPALALRIIERLEEIGLLQKGDCILDMMSGISTTLIGASIKQYPSIGVELESKFVLYSLQNFEYLTRRFCICNEQEDDGYLRWLREGIRVMEIEHTEEANRQTETNPMLRLQEKDDVGRDSPSGLGNARESKDKTQRSQKRTLEARSKSPLEGWSGNLGRLSLDLCRGAGSTNRCLQAGTQSDNGENVRKGDSSLRENTSSKWRQIGQSSRELNANDKFRTLTLAQFERQHSKVTLPKVCKTCGKPITPFPVILQGDARQLSQILSQKGLCGITSPPYQDMKQSLATEEDAMRLAKEMEKANPKYGKRTTPGRLLHLQKEQSGYSDNPSNIGNLKDKPMIGITSPPYEDSPGTPSLGTVNKDNWGKEGRDIVARRGLERGYSDNPANIGNLKDKPMIGITSPPYGNPRNTSEEYDNKYDLRRPEGMAWGRESFRGRYSENPDNIGHLPDKPFVAVTSPPYEDSLKTEENFEARKGRLSNIADNKLPGIAKHKLETHYGTSKGQIGKEQGETYLEAMLLCYKEASKICRVICTVTKNPTKSGKLRNLCKDTSLLLRLSGFRIVAYHRALLFEDTEQGQLDGSSVTKTKGRLSFFKRLSKQKGSPVAQWEDILTAINKGTCGDTC